MISKRQFLLELSAGVRASFVGEKNLSNSSTCFYLPPILKVNESGTQVISEPTRYIIKREKRLTFFLDVHTRLPATYNLVLYSFNFFQTFAILHNHKKIYDLYTI